MSKKIIISSRLRGLCPDPCPEKERYSRSAKNQLRTYEKDGAGSVDHRAALKEYSRSASISISHISTQ